MSIIYLFIILVFRNRIKINSKIIVNNTNKQVKVIQESLGGIRDIILQDNQKRFFQIFKKSDRLIRLRNANNSSISGFPRYFVEAIG